MTERYLGSIITASPTEPSEGYADSTASGVWNVHDPLIFNRASDWPDPTEASPSKFIENLFSSYAYTGDGSTQSITNGIDLSNEGGLVWIKNRTETDAYILTDTERGVGKVLFSDAITAESTDADTTTAFNSTGFSLGADVKVNTNTEKYISWTFRKQPKFFDVVTWDGNGSAGRTISHNLGSVPGMIIVKQSDSVADWCVFHRSKGKAFYGQLNSTMTFADDAGDGRWHDTDPTSTVFTVGSDSEVNQSGQSYVAYLFAHNDDDGGFGSTGDQDIIKCGTFDTNSDGDASVTLGFEPQWLIVKRSDGVGNWAILDDIRGWNLSWWNPLYADVTNAESGFAAVRGWPTSTGFEFDGQLSASAAYIYMAIRRGPMITPTAGTQVFFPDLITANQSDRSETGIGFSPDVIINLVRSRGNHGQQICSRLTGHLQQLFINYNSAESASNGTALKSFDMDGYTLGADTAGNGWNRYTGDTSVKHCFKRSPGFLDVVAYTGDGGSNRAVAHNLGVAPEFIAIRCRSNGDNFRVTTTDAFPDAFRLNSDGAVQTGVSAFNGASTPNATNFYVANDGEVNGSNRTYIAFLFATVAGVSKVGTYSGTGNDVNVDCGFTSGARFVLAKRTDSSGDWYAWDSARGIVAGNDPYMLYGPGAAVEVTNTDYIDPLSSGFTITSNAQSDLNTSGGTYLFLAIA